MKDYYTIPRVSNSSLSWFQKSPKYFKAMLDGEITEPPRTYFERGEQIHQYLLEPEEFEKNYIFLDYTLPKSPQQKEFCDKFSHKRSGTKEEKLLAAYKDVYVSKESDDKLLAKAVELEKTYKDYIKYLKLEHVYVGILPSSKKATFEKISNTVTDHLKANELMNGYQNDILSKDQRYFIANEFPIYWESNTPVPVECKSLLDRLVIDFVDKKIMLIDLKTTSHLAEFSEKFTEYKYYRQMAFYWMALYQHFTSTYPDEDWGAYTKETYIIAISTDELSEVEVFYVTEPTLNEGFDEITKLLDQIAWHQATDKWEHSRAYYEGITTKTL